MAATTHNAMHNHVAALAIICYSTLYLLPKWLLPVSLIKLLSSQFTSRYCSGYWSCTLCYTHILIPFSPNYHKDLGINLPTVLHWHHSLSLSTLRLRMEATTSCSSSLFLLSVPTYQLPVTFVTLTKMMNKFLSACIYVPPWVYVCVEGF